jgi:hypothetical protein
LTERATALPVRSLGIGGEDKDTYLPEAESSLTSPPARIIAQTPPVVKRPMTIPPTATDPAIATELLGATASSAATGVSTKKLTPANVAGKALQHIPKATPSIGTTVR